MSAISLHALAATSRPNNASPRISWLARALENRGTKGEKDLSPQTSDTHPDIERLQTERLRQMHGWRKLELMAEMSQAVRMLALAGLRERYPADTPAERRRRLADLILGPELAARAYGPFHGEQR
jgi:hypothetical protein